MLGEQQRRQYLQHRHQHLHEHHSYHHHTQRQQQQQPQQRELQRNNQRQLQRLSIEEDIHTVAQQSSPWASDPSSFSLSETESVFDDTESDIPYERNNTRRKKTKEKDKAGGTPNGEDKDYSSEANTGETSNGGVPASGAKGLSYSFSGLDRDVTSKDIAEQEEVNLKSTVENEGDVASPSGKGKRTVKRNGSEDAHQDAESSNPVPKTQPPFTPKTPHKAKDKRSGKGKGAEEVIGRHKKKIGDEDAETEGGKQRGEAKGGNEVSVRPPKYVKKESQVEGGKNGGIFNEMEDGAASANRQREDKRPMAPESSEMPQTAEIDSVGEMRKRPDNVTGGVMDLSPQQSKHLVTNCQYVGLISHVKCQITHSAHPFALLLGVVFFFSLVYHRVLRRRTYNHVAYCELLLGRRFGGKRKQRLRNLDGAEYAAIAQEYDDLLEGAFDAASNGDQFSASFGGTPGTLEDEADVSSESIESILTSWSTKTGEKGHDASGFRGNVEMMKIDLDSDERLTLGEVNG